MGQTVGWLTALWLMVAAGCFTLAAVHGQVWLRQRTAKGSAAFAVLAASVGLAALFEWRFMKAATPEEFGRMLWWFQLPIWSGIVAMVLFVRHYLKAGRAWLGWLVIGMRTVCLVINLLSPVNLNFSRIEAGKVSYAIGPIGMQELVDAVVPMIERAVGMDLFPADVYYISELPSKLNWPDVWFVGGVALVLAFLATLYPSWRAARIQPAEALRYE
jgi:ABC-type antimicrobial peptide transport system permease subunit